MTGPGGVSRACLVDLYKGKKMNQEVLSAQYESIAKKMGLEKEQMKQLLFADENEARKFLFGELLKIQEQVAALEKEKEILKDSEILLQKERQELERDRKVIRDKELFFEKKMQILKDGFFMLDQDRKKLEQEKAAFQTEKQERTREEGPRTSQFKKTFGMYEQQETSVFFGGVNSLLALKKRYRDLMKIYHPDNITGDHETLLVIQREYEDLLSYYEMGCY